jgi:hypothetical protein
MYAVLSKWYTIIIVGSVVVAYWVFDGLKKAGVIDVAETILTRSIEEVKGVAKNCTPQITNLENFWDCLSDPASSRYTPTDYEIKLQQEIMDQQKIPAPPPPDS